MRNGNRLQVVLASAALGLLAGCGDGGGSVASTPTPTPTPTPVAITFPLASATTAQTLTGTLVYTGHYGDGIATSSNWQLVSVASAGRAATVAISYDAVSGAYTIQNGANSLTVGSADRVTATGYAHAFSKTGTGVSDNVLLYGNALSPAPAAAPPLVLTYTSYGLWTHATTSPEQTTVSYFVYGEPTGSGAMPKSGTASYQTTLAGTEYTSAPALPARNPITGTATFSADFAANTVATTITTGNAVGTLSGTGTIAADQFSGTFTASSPQFSRGGFNGGFFGTGAQELGYTFWAHLHNPDPTAGASLAPADTYYSGVVLGKKN